MPGKHNNLGQFWQELKRRNVTRVLAVYIAAGFMILELVDMISDPLDCRNGHQIMPLFILKALYFDIIIAWIYDLHLGRCSKDQTFE